MYRATSKYTAQRQAAAQQAKRIAIAQQPAKARPLPLPDLRLRITVERFDFGHELHIFELHRTTRVDQYRAVVDGQTWKHSVGLARVLAGLRKSLPRVLSARNL